MRTPFKSANSVSFAALFLLALTNSLLGQMTRGSYDLPFSLGSNTVYTEKGRGTYCINFSGPFNATSQELRFVARWDGLEARTTLPRGSTTRTASVKTGKSLTLRQTAQRLQGAFNDFLLRQNSVPNRMLLRLGNVRFGSELSLVAESPETLRFDYLSSSGLRTVRFNRAEVAQFSKLLSAEPKLDPAHRPASR